MIKSHKNSFYYGWVISKSIISNEQFVEVLKAYLNITFEKTIPNRGRANISAASWF